jgi:hypothetical protein
MALRRCAARWRQHGGEGAADQNVALDNGSPRRSRRGQCDGERSQHRNAGWPQIPVREPRPCAFRVGRAGFPGTSTGPARSTAFLHAALLTISTVRRSPSTAALSIFRSARVFASTVSLYRQGCCVCPKSAALARRRQRPRRAVRYWGLAVKVVGQGIASIWRPCMKLLMLGGTSSWAATSSRRHWAAATRSRCSTVVAPTRGCSPTLSG